MILVKYFLFCLMAGVLCKFPCKSRGIFMGSTPFHTDPVSFFPFHFSRFMLTPFYLNELESK